MAIDGQSVAQIKTEVTASNTTEASFRSGMDHVLNEVDANSLPSGTTMVFYQSAAPTGWTKVTTHNDKALRVVSGSGGGIGGSTAFSSAFSHTHTDTFSVSGHVLTTAQMPIHSHTVVHGTSNSGSTSTIGAHDTASNRSTTTSTAGGNASHNHGLAGAVTSQTIAPYYVDVIICTRG